MIWQGYRLSPGIFSCKRQEGAVQSPSALWDMSWEQSKDARDRAQRVTLRWRHNSCWGCRREEIAWWNDPG